MLLAKNRKALFNFEVLDKLTAGIKLKGYEVKALREGKVNFEGSYVEVKNNEAFIKNLFIGKYSRQSQEVNDKETRRDRKLLLNAREIDALRKETAQKGKTAVPLALILEHNLVKLELAIVRGRREYEKKQVAKDRQVEKDLQIERKDNFKV